MLTLAKLATIAPHLARIRLNHARLPALDLITSDDGSDLGCTSHALNVLEAQIALLAHGVDGRCGDGSTYEARRSAAIEAMAIITGKAV